MLLKFKNKGFTLLEILLVVGIISLLAGIVIVAINPAKQLATVRNTERKSDIKQLNSALTQYYIDEFEFPDTITSSSTEICDTGILPSPSGVSCGSLIDLSVLVPDYITSIPTDPQAVTENGAGYNVLVSSGKIGLNATLAELDQTITLGIATGTGGGSSTLGDGLVAHYKMNDTDCTTVVDSAGNNDGSGTCTSVDGATADTGTALEFNGSTDYVLISNTQALNPGLLTFSAWVYSADGYFPAAGLISKRPSFFWGQFGDGGSSELGLYIWDTDGNGHAIGGAVNYGDIQNTWVHCAVTYDGNTAVFYKNGEEIYSEDAPYGSINTEQTGDLYIGYDYPNDGLGLRYINGYLDDVRIYNRALEESEILELAAGTEAE